MRHKIRAVHSPKQGIRVDSGGRYVDLVVAIRVNLGNELRRLSLAEFDAGDLQPWRGDWQRATRSGDCERASRWRGVRGGQRGGPQVAAAGGARVRGNLGEGGTYLLPRECELAGLQEAVAGRVVLCARGRTLHQPGSYHAAGTAATATNEKGTAMLRGLGSRRGGTYE